MVWRLATSLITLRDEINAYAPNRSKLSDGTIGDPAHQARCSRHNPNDSNVVCALDITNDPARGMNVHLLAAKLTLAPRHPELEYIVSNRMIASRSGGWVWRSYSGSNPHVLHAHFAVGRGSDCEPLPPYDSRQAWNVQQLLSPIVTTPGPVAPIGDDDMPVYVRTAENPNRILERLPGGAYVDVDDQDIFDVMGINASALPVKSVASWLIIPRQAWSLPAIQ